MTMTNIRLDLHDMYKNEFMGSFQQEKGMKSSECVWNSKLHADRVHGIKLWTFWGSALAWWENRSNTYKPELWNRIEKKKGIYPKKGDHVFFWTGMWPSGHVVVCDCANSYWIAALSQNSTWAHGDVPGDEILMKMYSYKFIVGWYTPKK